MGTDIICKHFLDAVENGKYGWVWSCPNGGDKCMYRHALPPGFVLKKDKQKAEKKDQMSIEELIENRMRRRRRMRRTRRMRRMRRTRRTRRTRRRRRRRR